MTDRIATPLLSTVASSENEAGNRLARTMQISLREGEDAGATVAALSGNPDVEYAGPVHLIPLAAEAPQFVPNDPMIRDQWHHDFIGSYQAWDRSTGDSSVVIAIIDTGVDLGHPDVAPNLWINEVEAAGTPGVDDDGNGYVDDVNGYDFTDVPEIVGAGDFRDRDPNPTDDVGHGTWVTGVACAAGNNSVGVAGVAFRSRVMALRAGFRPRSGFSLGFLAEDDAAAAIVYAVDNGAAVLNLSFGDLVRAPILEDAVRYALDRGVIVVAAAGNEGTMQPFYPAAMAGVLAVGASDRNGRRASFSTHGPAVSLLAPGAAIVTTDLSGDFTSKSGTSLASPVGAGVAALLRTLHPEWPASQVVAHILSTAVEPDPSADAKGGLFLRADRALDEGSGPVARFLSLADGDVVTGTVTLKGIASGPGVRGWRVAVRGSRGAWRTLFAEPRAHALEGILGTWNTDSEAEGPLLLKLEALGFDGPLAVQEARVRIDHTTPVVTGVRLIPVLSGGGYGLRVEADTDEPCRGSLRLDAGDTRLEARNVFHVDHHILGLDGPISRSGSPARMTLSFTNEAGLASTIVRDIQLPDLTGPVSTASLEASPGVRTWMKSVLDLNQDGQADLLAELPPLSGNTYGEVVALAPSRSVSCVVCPLDPLEIVWRSGNEFIQLDDADRDVDGRPEVLGLAFQEVRVYRSSAAGAYPTDLRWQTGEAWASRFIPSASGSGHEIVATRDTEIRIYAIESGEIVLRQTLPNSSPGGNAISPAVSAGDLDGDGRLSLMTVDGDGDLLVWTRSVQGSWSLRSTTRLTGAFATPLTVLDLDGDGRDEAVLVEAVGDLPSPAGGIRDGYYRLIVFRFGETGPEIWLESGASGYFPGNPVSLDAFDLDQDGRPELWLGVRDELHRLELVSGALAGTGYWSGITPGKTAMGRVRKDARDVSVLYFPGPVASGSSGLDFLSGRVLAHRPDLPVSAGVTGLRASEAEFSRSNVLIRLLWDPAGADYTVLRGNPGQPPHIVYRGSEAAYADTLIPGFTYTYQVYSGAPVHPAELTLTARPENRLESARVSGGALEIVWENPVSATERSWIEIESAKVSSLLLDRGGRRMLVRPDPPIEPGGRYRVELFHFMSDSNLPLRAPDNVVEITAPDTDAWLRLSAVRPVDSGTLDLDLFPEAPAEALPSLFQVGAGVQVRSVEMTGPSSLRLILDPSTPLRSGRNSVRMLPGLQGRNGESVRVGSGDELPFQLSPMVFPNPVRSEDQAVRFDWLSDDASVTVFDLAGRPVWSGSSGHRGWLEWNLKSDSGEPVAPGAYLFEVAGVFGGRGKLAILR